MPLVAFCGIDGAGKTALVREVHDRLARDHPGMPVATRGLVVAEARQRVTRHVRFCDPGAYLQGPAGQLYVLACALDFCEDLERSPLPAPLGGGGPLVLSDRYVDCYVAFTMIVDPPCPAPVRALLASLPPADLVLHVVVPPELAWRRIQRRPGGPTPDESLEKLQRFERAYRSQFAGRPDIVAISNEGPLAETAGAVVGELLRRRMVGC